MYCPRCAKHVQFTETQLHLSTHNMQGNIYRTDCKFCNKFIAVKLDGEVVDLNKVNSDKIGNGWAEVETNREKIIYYVLSQIIYPEFDAPRADMMESPYDIVDDADNVYLRWLDGKPVGFYTVKPKGTEVFSTKERYVMPVIDTAYVRSEYRNRGFGYEILTDMVERFPNDDIGFSKPVSKGMLKVVKKFLTKHKEYRLRFWEIADCDIVSGSQQLLWCRVRNQHL